jgi:hypothetical protein
MLENLQIDKNFENFEILELRRAFLRFKKADSCERPSTLTG